MWEGKGHSRSAVVLALLRALGSSAAVDAERELNVRGAPEENTERIPGKDSK